MSILFQRVFWLNLAGACATAVVAAAPILMSGVMDRGFEIAKQSVAEPLAVLAFGAVLVAGGWQGLSRQSTAIKIAVTSFGIFLLLALVSTALSENPEVAMFGGYYRHEGLLAWIVYGAFFFSALGWARDSERIAGFLDVMLLASAIPAAYALQQRLDLDFYPLGMRDFARPGGTMGSPVFLAAYLGLLLPITAARCWQARHALSELVLWLMIAILQVCGLLVTQSRGPLLAALFGILMIACCAAARARARRFFISAFAILAITLASVVAINTLPAARHWAQDIPVAGRLVFNLERDAAFTTQLASRSAATRLAIWGAGVETFAAAPIASKLLGYGPESAYLHYFPYMPASVMRLAGYGAYTTYDRMHADTLDIGLNFGLLAWLVYCLFFGTVMYVAARALWGLSGAAPCWLFAGFACMGGVFSSAAAVQLGFAAAAVPAFGLGICAGWFLFMAGCAWRGLKQGVPPMSARQSGRWILIAGLSAALWVFWSDAQINIPVLTTRLISFAIAALILLIADEFASHAGKDADLEPAPVNNNLQFWGVACALVAVCASCLPIISIDASASGQGTHWLRRTLPVLLLLFYASLHAWAYARRSGSFKRDLVPAWLAIVVGLPMLYALIHLALTVKVTSEPDLSQVRTIAIASIAGPVFIVGLCIAYALKASHGVALNMSATFISRAARWWIGVVAAAVLLVAVMGWSATQADVASSLALDASAKQSQFRQQLIAESIRLQPYERYYRRQQVFDLLGTAVADIRQLEKVPERIPIVMRSLAAAETAARTAALLFPRDPWVVVALANVLQIEALRVLRPLDPAGGLRAAREANQLFARTHQMFPSEPLLLRNWAELQADQGDLPDAYRLLDRMEGLVPNDPEPYSSRIAIANQVHDKLTVSATLARARLALEPLSYERLLAVANEQQN